MRAPSGQYSVSAWRSLFAAAPGNPRANARMARAMGSASDVFLDRVERILRAYGTRLVLSFLIVLSVLPAATLGSLFPARVVGRLDLVFLSLVSSSRWLGAMPVS